MKPCEWCGHDHPVTVLCSKRPKLTRRNFICLFGAGVAGMVLAPPLEIGLVEPPVVLDLEAFGRMTSGIWMQRLWPGYPTGAMLSGPIPSRFIQVPILGAADGEK